jgi:hypothetical protein
LRYLRVSDAVRLQQEVALLNTSAGVQVHLQGEWREDVDGLDVLIPFVRPDRSGWFGACFGVEKLPPAGQLPHAVLVQEAAQCSVTSGGSVLLGVDAPVWCTFDPMGMRLHLRRDLQHTKTEWSPFDFSFSLFFMDDNPTPQGALQRARSKRTELQYYLPDWAGKGDQPQSGSWLHLDGQDIILHTIKPADNGSGMVLRMTSLSKDPRRSTLSGKMLSRYQKAFLVDPLELKRTPIAFNKIIMIDFKPFELITLLLE